MRRSTSPKPAPGPNTLPVSQLVLPLAVINVADAAAANPDYQLTPADLRRWERRYGRLPGGCCVAMNSGWARHVGSDRFTGRDAQSVLHFPGFHPEATDWLMKERRVRGMAVDTLSLDYGASTDFKTHYAWLPVGALGPRMRRRPGPGAAARRDAGGRRPQDPRRHRRPDARAGARLTGIPSPRADGARGKVGDARGEGSARGAPSPTAER